jgi:hypothetical protein
MDAILHIFLMSKTNNLLCFTHGLGTEEETSKIQHLDYSLYGAET